MRITNLTLENFRSFGKRQTIPFAPLTLLFGPNSVGKSTVLMALFYVQQILAKGQCDPQRIEAMGNRFVGGFRQLVHGKFLDKPIRIGIEFEIDREELGASYSELGDLVTDNLGSLGELVGFSNFGTLARLDFEISWSKKREKAYISKYTVSFDQDVIAEVTSDSGLEQPMITGIHYHHEFFYHEWFQDWVNGSIENSGLLHPNLQYFAGGDEEEWRNDFKELYPYEFSENGFLGDFHELVQVSPIETAEPEGIQPSGSELEHRIVDHARSRPVGFKGFTGALPKPGALLHASLPIDDDFKHRIGLEILSDILVAPLDNLLKILNQSLCIGPLRHIADPKYQANSEFTQADWYEGKACWDVLASMEPERDSLINSWLSDRDKLNLGYEIVYKKMGIMEDIIPLDAEISSDKLESLMRLSEKGQDIIESIFEGDRLDHYRKDLAESVDRQAEDVWLREAMSNLESLIGAGRQEFKKRFYDRTQVSLWDKLNDIEVFASDIGVGVSQLMPLVVACFKDQKPGLIACEQPELHVHPRIQVAIGDLLIAAMKKKNFLIETHSEHLVLRLLRRIRESESCGHSENPRLLTPDDVSLIYLEPSNEGVVVNRLKITNDGDFEEKWPGGFFEERDEELF